jgi:uncharacterized membrane protein YgcG
MTIHRFVAIAALLCVGSPAQADVITGNVIGGFAEVANNVSGALPGQQPAPKQLKSPAHFGEKVLTEVGSRANISFIDGSHVLIGEKAELTIDAFVFDPKTGTERAAYNIAAGALRFVSGAIKSDSIKIQTPTAAIAVRGTNFKLKVLADGTTIVSVNRGSVEVTSRRTFATATLGPGQSVSAGDQGLGSVDANEVEVADEFVDNVALDGDPDLAEVGLSELGFSDEEASEIETALSEAESEDGDADNADGDSDGGDGGDADGGDSGDGGNSGGDGGDGGGGDGGGGDGGGGGGGD